MKPGKEKRRCRKQNIIVIAVERVSVKKGLKITFVGFPREFGVSLIIVPTMNYVLLVKRNLTNSSLISLRKLPWNGQKNSTSNKGKP